MVSGTVVGKGTTAVSKTDLVSVLMELTFWWKERKNM